MWEKNIDPLPPVGAPTGGKTHNRGMCPDRELNLQPFDVPDDTPTNQATQPGLVSHFNLR